MNNDGVGVRGFEYTLETTNPHTGVLELTKAHNRIPQAALDFLLQSPFGDVPPIGTFYCALFTKNFFPAAGTKAADIPSTMGEFVDYVETSRPVWAREYRGVSALDNFNSKAIFVPTKDVLVFGAVLVSSPTKGSPDGLVLSVVRFSTAKNLYAGEEAKLVAGLTYIPTNTV